mmetsp:Transcript_22342/g.71437  ORF Transcript_22342/g.71437 Transcript_22342/m.71437 type:complete len:382 (-) Transcript_22342:1514-2659(-)
MGDEGGRLGWWRWLLVQVVQHAGLALAGATAMQVLRLLILPGAARRRERLGYKLANLGNPPKGLPPIAPVTRVSPRVVRLLGLNPGPFTLQGTNTYLVGTGSERILVDAGDGAAAYLTQLRKVLREEKATLSHVVITHAHEDHVGGIPALRRAFPGLRVWKQPRSSLEVDPGGRPYDGILQNGTVVAEEGATLRAVLTPGHTVDHVALVLEEEGSVFTGDCVLGSGTAIFEDLHQYMGSLRILKRELQGYRKLAEHGVEGEGGSFVLVGRENSSFAAGEGVGRIYPGHGLVVDDGVARVEEYIAHRQLREDQIVRLLGSHGTMNVAKLVDMIYADQHLSWIVKRGAARSVRQHLDKLHKEDAVRSLRQDEWELAHPGSKSD